MSDSEDDEEFDGGMKVPGRIWSKLYKWVSLCSFFMELSVSQLTKSFGLLLGYWDQWSGWLVLQTRLCLTAMSTVMNLMSNTK